LKAALIATLFTGMIAPEAFAQSGSGSAGSRAISVVHIPGSAVPFDWLAKKRASKGNTLQDAELVSSQGAATTNRQRFFGKGSYICSPAGFGKKSRCFTR
jgi:hypothetical protein